eukprot:COSAG03_NODE_437_length_7919_cov_5.570332_8_plen_78_part_00
MILVGADCSVVLMPPRLEVLLPQGAQMQRQRKAPWRQAVRLRTEALLNSLVGQQQSPPPPQERRLLCCSHCSVRRQS